MKKLSFAALFLASLTLILSAPPARAEVQVSISIGGFYDELSPYGRWVDCRWGGCWVPGGVSRDWQPYSNGEWIYTEYGWTWISDDPWGDDPYHYGTWAWTDLYGWVWIPGTIWAPAWVTWSYSDDYIGWAPLPPTIVVGWSGYSGSPIRVTPTSYVFVPIGHFCCENVSPYWVPRDRSTTIFRRTRPVTRFAVSGGIVRNTAIPLETVQRRTRTRIERRNIREAKTAPRPVSEWNRGERRHVAIVAPARDVRETVSSRSRGGARSEGPKRTTHGNEPINRRPETGRQQPADRRQPAARHAPEQRQPAPPVHARPPKAAPQQPARPTAPAKPAQKSLPPPAVQAKPAAPAQVGKPGKGNNGSQGEAKEKAVRPAKPGKPGKP